MRQEEHEEYLKASSDFKLSAEAVAKAIGVLSDYYNSAAFVQVNMPVIRPRGGSEAGRQAGQI